MITVILLVIFGLAFGTLWAQKRFNFIEKDGDGNLIRVHYKPIVFAVTGLVFIFLQPYEMKKIEAGYQGLLVDLVGDSRGASTIKEVSGWKVFNTWTEEIHQIPLDQRTIRYEKQAVIAKGGFPCDISPSFNHSVKRSTSSDMFTNLRTSFRNGGLEAIEQGWLEIAILGAVSDVANKWVIDDIFNNRSGFEAAIVVEANKRVGKWFTISQLRTNIQPPSSIVESIKAKAKAVQDAITSESQAKAATADAQRKIALAKGDSATVVIEASSEAAALRLKQKELTPLYVEFIKASKWNGELPTTSLGNATPMINLK
ncbi:MAG TPA: SPFH domain-containing protein [Flavobacterium sp.]|jgi:regulator of protease activity HflC (stomatin/prohibitin superfamily)